MLILLPTFDDHPILRAWFTRFDKKGATRAELDQFLTEDLHTEIEKILKIEGVSGRYRTGGATGGLTERTMRYFATKGWVEKPHRERGERAIYYKENHLLQLLLAARRRAEGAPAEKLEEVRTMLPLECLQALFPNITIKDQPQMDRLVDRERGLAVVLCHTSEDLSVATPDSARMTVSMSQVLADTRAILGPMARILAIDETPGTEKIPYLKDIDFLRQDHKIAPDELLHFVTTRQIQEPISAQDFVRFDSDVRRNAILHIDRHSYDLRNGHEVAPHLIIAVHSLLHALFVILGEDGVSPESLVHKTSRACLLDYCMQKRDVYQKLRTADFCQDCWPTVRDHVPELVLGQLKEGFERIRLSARAWE